MGVFIAADTHKLLATFPQRIYQPYATKRSPLSQKHTIPQHKVEETGTFRNYRFPKHCFVLCVCMTVEHS